jgi:glycosyltransferase involved in cell wall biosynthesis
VKKSLPSSIRIAYVIDRLDTGGTERQLKYLIEGLDRKRFDPVLYLLRGDSDHHLKLSDTPVHTLNVNSLISISGLLKLLSFARTLKNYRFDIVQTFFQDATFLGVLAAKMANIPAVVISIRDLLFWSRSTPVTFAIYRFMTALTDGVLVNSKAVKHCVARFVRNRKIRVIPNGIPFPEPIVENSAPMSLRSELGIRSEAPLVVLVSNCNRRVKRVDLLIEAIPLVLRHHFAHFMLVGDGHLRPILEARACELGVIQHITFAGHRQDISRILSEAYIALNTSDSEGLSNSIMEAMQAGLPVVASDVMGNRELLSHGINGLLFKPGDYKNLAACIVKLLENQSLRISMSHANCARIIRDYAIDVMIKRHSEYYKMLAYSKTLSRHDS